MARGRLATRVVVVLVALAAVPMLARPAQAMTATAASGYPGDAVTVDMQNQAGQTNTSWVINAPDGLTFAGVPASNNPPGTGAFACRLTSSTRATCGPSALWAANNTVRAVFAVPASATARPYVGSVSLGGESAAITVTVLPPSAPPITAPAANAVTLDRTPTVTGTKRAGNAVAVSAAGSPLCTVPADTATSWSCTPTADQAFGPVTASATQASPGGDVSPPSTRSFVVIDHLLITTPVDGTRTTGRTQPISGTGALPGESVTVTVGGQTVTTAADPAGAWSTTVTGLPAGVLSVAAGRTVNGQSFAAPPVSLTIAPVPVVIRSPLDGAVTYEPTVAVLGDGAEAGAAVTVVVDGTTYAVTADAAGTWATPPIPGLAQQPHTVSAVQTVNAVTSDPVTSGFAVVPLAAPVIASPADGASSTQRSPVVLGTAVPGALVTVQVAGQTYAIGADAAGQWQTPPLPTLSIGAQSVTATQTVGSVTSPPTASTFTVLRPPPSSSPPPPVRPTPSVPRPPAPTPPAPTAPVVPPPAVAPPAPPPTSGSVGAGMATAATPPSDPNDFLPLGLGFAPGRLTPGQVASMVGTLGPNAADQPVTVTLSGSMNKGMIYRSVQSDPEGTCTVTTGSFVCQIVLQPGQQATLEIRILADQLNAPSTARQQLTVATAGPGGAAAEPNTVTQTTAVDAGASDTTLLATSISTFPGPGLVLLALFLLALAATETERRRYL